MEARIAWGEIQWAELKCPRCKAFLAVLPAGTPVNRGYCKACGLKFVELVVRA